jgi:hypothetical protein
LCCNKSNGLTKQWLGEFDFTPLPSAHSSSNLSTFFAINEDLGASKSFWAAVVSVSEE